MSTKLELHMRWHAVNVFLLLVDRSLSRRTHDLRETEYLCQCAVVEGWIGSLCTISRSSRFDTRRRGACLRGRLQTCYNRPTQGQHRVSIRVIHQGG
jgi:hypothetical protein